MTVPDSDTRSAAELEGDAALAFWQQAHARLSEQAEEDHPPAWQPEAGESLLGVVEHVNPAVHTAYGPVPVVTLRGPNGGRRSVWLHHAVLRRAFVRADVQLGELVYIKFVGRVEPEGGGNPYADYRFAVDRAKPTGSPAWGAIAAAHDDPVDSAAAAFAAPADVEAVREAGPDQQRRLDDEAPLGASAAVVDDDIPF